MTTLRPNALVQDRSALSAPSAIGAGTSMDENIVRIASFAPEGTMSAYSEEIAEFFDSHENRSIRSLMQSNRAPFLS